jgi:hypothetical protein
LSFDLFVGFYKDGEHAPVPRTIFERAFGRYVERREPGCVVLAFPDGGGPEVFVDDVSEITGFMITHPPANEAFWDGLEQILREGRGVLYWPGSRPVVVDETAIAHLPKDMVEAIGAPVVVHGSAEIVEAIRNK